MTPVTVLAHAGPGSSWQAMVVIAAFVLAGFLLAAATGRLALERPDDLVVPLAAAAIVSSFGTLGHELLSDAIGWALPVAVVALLAMLLAAATSLDVRFPSPLPMGAVALAAVGALVLHQPLSTALHPPAELLPLSDDASLTIAEPADGAVLAGERVTVTVEVSGASIGPGDVPQDQLPDDPEEAGALSVAMEAVRDDGEATQRQLVDVAYPADCTLAEPCRRVSFEVDPPPGTHRLTIEFVRGDGTPLAPFVRESITFTRE